MPKKREQMQEVMDLLVDDLSIKMSVYRIGDKRYEADRAYPCDCNKKYDNYHIDEFLILYKIEYLSHHKKIDQETRDTLIGLFKRKKALEKEMEPYIIIRPKDKTPEEQAKQDQLLDELMEIEAIFEAYHLLSTPEELLDTLTSRLDQLDFTQKAPLQKEKKD